MKVLWIVHTALEPISLKIYQKPGNGLWMSALLDTISNSGEFEFAVATTAAVGKTECVTANGVKYYALPDRPPSFYDENKESNIKAWRELFELEKPDLIEIWGTEFTHGLCALRVSGGIPSIVRMQGYLSAIAQHYLAGMSRSELKKNITFRDIIKRDSIARQQKKYCDFAKKEAEIIRLSGNVICQNGWGEAVIKSRNPSARVYFCPLSINSVFKKYDWSIENAEPRSIICNASGYSLKGLHVLLRAAALLKNKYPDIKLYVPGEKMESDGSIQWLLRKRGYTKFIERLIGELGIKENVIWLGRITHEELAAELAKKSVFVLCSAAENQSSSLIEAMTVGVPSVASAVGEVPEFVRNGENGLLYRFGEHDVLAHMIDKVFSDEKLAKKLSENGKKDMIEAHDADMINSTMIDIYKSVLRRDI